MPSDRMVRVNELMKREIAESIPEVVQDAQFDASTVTITGVATSRNLREARVLVSIRADEEGRERVLRILRRHRGAFQARINRDLKLKYTPRLSFQLDRSLEKGDAVLQILSEMAAEEEPADRETEETDEEI